MSSQYTTAQLVAKIQQRIPMGLDPAYCMDKLNEAAQWIEQQGAFTWNIAYADVTVRAHTFWVAPGDMPAKFDAGKPVTVYGQTFSSAYGSFGAPVPYVAPDLIGLHQLYLLTLPAGVFSVFTVVTNLGTASPAPSPVPWPTEVPFLLFAPSVSLPSVDVSYHCIYHQVPTISLTVGTDYYPTPNPFDILILDLTEAEIKRNYQLTGWEAAAQKAQNSTLLLLDKYRSPKREMAGITEQAKETQESQLQRAE